jgi:flagellin-like protein
MRKKNNAVSEIVGTIVLLGIAIALFSIVQTFAFFMPNNPKTPSAQLFGTIDKGVTPGHDDIVIEHHRGESISLNSEILIRIEGSPDVRETAGSATFSLKPNNGNNYWDIGETITYHSGEDLTDKGVEVIIVDSESNSVVLMATLQ